MGMSAQSIVGTWADEPEKDESGQTEQVILNIGQKTFEMNILVDSSDEETGTVIVSVSLPGTYTCKDSQLVVALDTEHADAKIEKMEFTKEIQAVFDEMPEMKTMIDNKMAEMVNGLGASLKQQYGTHPQGAKRRRAQNLHPSRQALIDRKKIRNFPKSLQVWGYFRNFAPKLIT